MTGKGPERVRELRVRRSRLPMQPVCMISYLVRPPPSRSSAPRAKAFCGTGHSDPGDEQGAAV